jgi:hypothetical protein
MRISGHDIPGEHVPHAKRVLDRCALRMGAFFFGVVILMSTGGTGMNLIVRSVFETGDSLVIRFLTLAPPIAVAAWLLRRVRRADAADVAAFLRGHGYCACGYKGVRSTDSASVLCPECGRCWSHSQRVVRATNNPP